MNDEQDNDIIDQNGQPEADTPATQATDPVTGQAPEPNNPSDQSMVPVERYKNAQALMTKATMESADLRREVASLRAQIDSLMSNRQAPSRNSDQDGIDFAALDKLKEEYPDFAIPVVSALERQQRVISELRASNVATEQRTAEVRKNAFNEAIRRVHEDFETVANSEDFRGWLARQVPFVQNAARSSEASDAIEVLSMYKASAGGNDKVDKVAAARQVAAPAVGRNSRQPTPDKPQQFTRDQISKMSAAEFEKNEAAIEKAMMSGNIT